jgi:hypothetical protein
MPCTPLTEGHLRSSGNRLLTVTYSMIGEPERHYGESNGTARRRPGMPNDVSRLHVTWPTGRLLPSCGLIGCWSLPT